MKPAFLIIILFLSAGYFIYPQNKISINSGWGYYLNNSENSLKIMGDKRYKSYFQFGTAYQCNIFGNTFMFEYTYHQMMKEDVIQFSRTASELDENGNVVILGTIGTDASIINHNFDLDYVGTINLDFSYGFGPSFIITNRIIEVEPYSTEGEVSTHSLYDKLASSGLGVNAFISYFIPFSDQPEHFFFNSMLKLRYTHSIWFDKGIRNLDNYKQEFLVFNLSIGIGYSF
jgi:hypothetical protein